MKRTRAPVLTATARRVRRAKQVSEALAIFREKHRMTYPELHLAIWNTGVLVSERTLKRLILLTHTPHATTLAAIEAFLRNAGAPSLIKGLRTRQVKVVRVRTRRGAWSDGSRGKAGD